MQKKMSQREREGSEKDEETEEDNGREIQR